MPRSPLTTRWLARALALLGLIPLGACCIPFPEEGLAVPELEVVVVDPAGAPVADAEVVVRRFVTAPSPHTELGRRTGRTDADGVLRFEREVVDERSMPLMMHGRPDIGFELCADAGERGAAMAEPTANGRDPGAPAETLEITIDPEVRGCAWSPE
ncbi:MAG TPA: carboxypeptidase-like regulatory domain-containing protein [Sandaracinaceae bacterium LLY-WYZ-13_1]|nr:carboxypeptidase-like regulatory domain-containing protein [Sandaracinaceae bacterium LLY-WYZ-13_1]